MFKVFLFLFLLPTFIFADFTISDYKFQKEILPSEKQRGDFSFKVDSDIYKNGNQFFSDIRIADQKNNEIPYLIEKKKDRQKREFSYEEIKIFSQKNNTYILDLGNNRDYYDSIIVENNSKDFSRAVDVYGSNLENTRYEKLSLKKDNLIFSDPTGNEKTIFFKFTEYRFIKLIFSGNEGNFKPNKFLIRNNKIENIFEEKEVLELKFSELSSQNVQEQKFLIEIEKENIPIDFLSFIAGEKSFSRKIQIFSSNKKDARFLENGKRYNKNETYWKKVFDGDFSKKIYSENQEFKINDNKKYYLLVIKNEDDKKVSIKNILGTRFFDIVYINNLNFTNNIYNIFYGNVLAKKPKYDIQNIRKDTNDVVLGQEKNNPLYIEKNKLFKEETPIILYTLIIFIILILGWFTYKVLKETAGVKHKTKENNIKDL